MSPPNRPYPFRLMFWRGPELTMSPVETVILGIIEGLTEFLPVSSTGHMILASAIMGIGREEFVKTFEIAIQLGAILSVLALYYRRFLVSTEIYLKLAVAFFPTGVIGLLAYKTIKHYLFNKFIFIKHIFQS